MCQAATRFIPMTDHSYRKRSLLASLRGYAYIAPAVLVLGVFGVFPLFYGFYVSWFDWGLTVERFVGFANYSKALFDDADFWRALRVTVYYAIGTVPVTMAIAFVIANLLFQRIRGRSWYRMIYFLPYITSTVAAAAVWRWVFYPHRQGLASSLLAWLMGSAAPDLQWVQDSRGVIALLGEWLGIDLSSWAEPSLALVCVMIFSIWHSLGFHIVIMLAGLTAIPKELLEAASIDGATGFKRARYVTLPLLSPTLFFLLLISTIRAFRTFNEVYVMASGETTGSVRTLTMYIFQCFYESEGKVGYGCAVACLLFLMILLLTLVQTRLIGRRVHYG